MALWLTLMSAAQAHEVFPTIIDMEQDGSSLKFEMGVGVGANLESFVAGIDLATVTDTDNAAEAADYDSLRAMPPDEFEEAFRAFWPEMAERMVIAFDDGDGLSIQVTPELTDVMIPEVGDVEVLRASTASFTVEIPEGFEAVQVGWDPAFGAMVLRQQGVEAPYSGNLAGGEVSDPIALAGGSQLGPIATFFDYIPAGFDHIIPKGLDHILFVLGLFFLSTRFGALLWQVSAFTLAHTITLALAAQGIVNIPGNIVEPLIALSIVYVAFENIYTDGLSPWRPFVIFGFGLLHGLGFASVLAEYGLPDDTFIAALIGFNIGVEVGQLAVIAVAFLIVKMAIDQDRLGTANKLVSALFLAGAIVVMGSIIFLSESPAYGDLLPLIVMVSILMGFTAASLATARYDSYREMVAIPSSILIAIVAAYWCFERVFL